MLQATGGVRLQHCMRQVMSIGSPENSVHQCTLAQAMRSALLATAWRVLQVQSFESKLGRVTSSGQQSEVEVTSASSEPRPQDALHISFCILLPLPLPWATHANAGLMVPGGEEAHEELNQFIKAQPEPATPRWLQMGKSWILIVKSLQFGVVYYVAKADSLFS